MTFIKNRVKPLVYILPLEYKVKGGVEIKETEFIEKSAYDEAERQNAALALKAEEQAELIEKLVGALEKLTVCNWPDKRCSGKDFMANSFKKNIEIAQEALDEYEKFKANQS